MTRGTPITGAAGTSAGRADGSRTRSAATRSTASALLDQVFRTAPRQLLLCGDSTLALAILRELARRAWEWPGAEAAAAPGTEPRWRGRSAEHLQQLAAPLPVQRVLLLDRRADDLRREYLATSPARWSGRCAR